MHSLNVEKSNEQAVESLLSENNIPFEVYDAPETYSVISTEGVISEALFDKIDPLINESGSIWDWRKVYPENPAKEE